MPLPEQLLFLPGASGNVEFWKPVADRLSLPIENVQYLGWPGFGPTPADPSVATLHDLVQQTVACIDRPTALIAQSMGAVVALLATLARPTQITHLVIAALSGGVDMRRHGARDWRPPREQIDPLDPAHLFAAYDEDLSALLPHVKAPTLLLWGDEDPVSPAAVGQWLAKEMPDARLHVVRGGTHTFSNARADEVAPLIQAHLTAVR